jgi:hypothetical protein
VHPHPLQHTATLPSVLHRLHLHTCAHPTGSRVPDVTAGLAKSLQTAQCTQDCAPKALWGLSSSRAAQPSGVRLVTNVKRIGTHRVLNAHVLVHALQSGQGEVGMQRRIQCGTWTATSASARRSS